MLVPYNIVSEWYNRRSLVYRNFAYLFQNPLWQKPVPQGFSVCPFFWLALFSATLFRVLVYATLGLSALVRTFRLQKLIAFTDSLGPEVTVGANNHRVPCLPTVIGALILAVFGAVLAMVGCVIYTYWTAGIFSTLVLPALVWGFYAAAAGYIKNHDSPDRCRVEVYARVVAFLSVVLAFILHPELACWSFFSLPVLLIGTALHNVWVAIVWVFHWIAALFLAFFGSRLTLVLSATGLAFLVIYGWLFGRWMDSPEQPPVILHPSRKQIRNNLNVFASFLDSYVSGYRDSIFHDLHHIAYAMALAKSRPDLDRDSLTPEERQGLLDAYRAYQADKQAREDARAALCKLWTGRLLTLFSPVTATWKQFRILASYLWQFGKAIKTKQCPFLRFHD